MPEDIRRLFERYQTAPCKLPSEPASKRWERQTEETEKVPALVGG